MDSIIFDLDGTLWDASITSAKAWNSALDRLSLKHRIVAEDVRKVSGQPFEVCVATLFPEPTHVAQDSLVTALDEVEKSTVERDGGALYDGVQEGIRLLAAQFPLFIVSNCQSWYIEAFLDSTGLRGYFKDYESHGRTGKPKSANIMAILERNRLVNPVYVGDTASDQTAATDAGVEFIHVSYGFGVPEQPCATFGSFPELLTFFMNHSTQFTPKQKR